MPGRPSPIGHAIALLAIATLACAVYANTLHAPFQLDDTYYISDNPLVRDLACYAPGGCPDTSAPADFRTQLKTRYLGYLSFALDYRIHATDAAGYHALNIALHALAGCALHALALMLFGIAEAGSALYTHRMRAALLVALLFVAHPLSTEAVNYVFQRPALLAAVFYISASALYMMYLRASRATMRRGAYAIALLLTALAMKTKENAFSLPVALMVIDFAAAGQGGVSRLKRLAPFVICMAIVPLGLIGLGRPAGEVIGAVGPAMRGYAGVGRAEYLFTEFGVLAGYIRLALLPVGQSLLHGVEARMSFMDAAVLAPAVALLALLAASVHMYIRGGWMRVVSFGVLWFFITLSVESSFIPLPMFMNEYRAYPALAGLCITAVAGGVAMAGALNRRHAVNVVTGAMLIAVVVFAVASHDRNELWQSRAAMWSDVVEKNPLSPYAQNNLGTALRDGGRTLEAFARFSRALELKPHFPDAMNNMALTYMDMGRPERAVPLLMQVTGMDPGHYQARNNLANAYRQLGDPVPAEANYLEAIRLRPDFGDAYNNLGVLMVERGQHGRALKYFTLAVKYAPDMADANFNLALSLLEAGDSQSAAHYMRRVIELDPSDYDARAMLAEIVKIQQD